MNVLGRIFLNYRTDGKTERRKDGVFFVRCRRTYVLNNSLNYSIVLIICLPHFLILYKKVVDRFLTLTFESFMVDPYLKILDSNIKRNFN